MPVYNKGITVTLGAENAGTGKCRTKKCGNENERLENAGPGKCRTWNTNNEFHIYTRVTDTSSRPQYIVGTVCFSCS